MTIKDQKTHYKEKEKFHVSAGLYLPSLSRILKI